jgi:hypothetical protein
VNSPSGGQPPGGGPAGGSETSDTANGELPEETGGPFPGDGSNGANVLNQSGIVRRDITSSFGSSTTKAEGVRLNITMTINDFANNKSPLAGGAVYRGIATEGRYPLLTGVAGRTTCAASRNRWQRTGEVHHDLSCVTRAVVHITSRSTPVSKPRTARTRSLHRKWPCPNHLQRSCG